MKKLLIILPLLLLASCAPDLTRQETVAACKECTDAGFDAVILYNELTGNAHTVRCEGKEATVPQVRDHYVRIK